MEETGGEVVWGIVGGSLWDSWGMCQGIVGGVLGDSLGIDWDGSGMVLGKVPSGDWGPPARPPLGYARSMHQTARQYQTTRAIPGTRASLLKSIYKDEWGVNTIRLLDSNRLLDNKQLLDNNIPQNTSHY